MPAFETVLRSCGATLLILLAITLFRARRQQDWTAELGAALCLSVAAFLVTSAPNADAWLGVFVYPLTALCATHPVWFWLFSTALFRDRFVLGPVHVASLVGIAILGCIYQARFPTPNAPADDLTELLGLLVGAASLGFALLAPLSVWLDNRNDLDESRRRIRRRFIPILSAYLSLVIGSQLYVLFSGVQTASVLVLLNLTLIAALAALGLTTFVRARVVHFLDAPPPTRDVSALSRVEMAVLERLERRFEAERLYARESLGVASLAKALDTQEHVLRRVINRGLGYKNFNDFLHAHRLREVARRLRDPAEQRLPVLTIALEAGYGSIGPFNRAFKARFGTTPSAYRRGDGAESASNETASALK
jgi:AraC-like DNA-binding protein